MRISSPREPSEEAYASAAIQPQCRSTETLRTPRACAKLHRPSRQLIEQHGKQQWTQLLPKPEEQLAAEAAAVEAPA